jgi:hypothetical protein
MEAQTPPAVEPFAAHIGAGKNLNVVPVAVPSRESLDATGDVGPVSAGDVNVGAVGPSAEDKCSPRSIHVSVDLTLRQESLVHGFGRAVPAVLRLRHAVGEGYESLASVRAEAV